MFDIAAEVGGSFQIYVQELEECNGFVPVQNLMSGA